MHRVRTIFLSDIHLGTRACQAERLLSFLRSYESERIFLIGDIIDFWSMQRSIHWTPAQNTVVQKILKRARHGTEVLFIPGNHDEALRDYVGIRFGDIRVEREYVHQTADGRRFLIIHGDEFDQVTRHHRWVAVMGDLAYNFLVLLNGGLSRLRRLLKQPGYWSLAGYAKRQVKSAVSFIFDFEDSVIHGVKQRGLDGVVCGHIHAAAIRDHLGLCYVNCGDWVDSCTAVVEHLDGRLELVEWTHDRGAHGEEEERAPLSESAPEALSQAAASAPQALEVEAALVSLQSPVAGGTGGAASGCTTSWIAAPAPRDLAAVHAAVAASRSGASDFEAGWALSAASAPLLPEPAIFFDARAFP